MHNLVCRKSTVFQEETYFNYSDLSANTDLLGRENKRNSAGMKQETKQETLTEGTVLKAEYFSKF